MLRNDLWLGTFQKDPHVLRPAINTPSLPFYSANLIDPLSWVSFLSRDISGVRGMGAFHSAYPRRDLKSLTAKRVVYDHFPFVQHLCVYQEFSFLSLPTFGAEIMQLNLEQAVHIALERNLD